MDKKELIANIAQRASIKETEAAVALNEAIAEMVSPSIFKQPGEEVGFINDNHCHNNCKEQLATRELLAKDLTR
ncbi:hypothetical protein Thimo_0525 [Thioflavicoccus mobilis 8321]|uniref:Uncharacterized protein n=1 Tax=Thioflavicoccus mobilis 8321 TaxID=765912 RepID=L0GU86_9GAMM|nr:hypothetical protein [Thioflavicoccus mobilis]AGA89377.1 hypothetical protein Thimo_0525 [Thioflavicoccus mobilis 8321]